VLALLYARVAVGVFVSPSAVLALAFSSGHLNNLVFAALDKNYCVSAAAACVRCARIATLSILRPCSVISVSFVHSLFSVVFVLRSGSFSLRPSSLRLLKLNFL